MMNFLVLRARLRSLYQKFELYIDPSIKFIVAFIVYQLINSSIGYDDRLKKIPIVFALSLLSAFTPSAILVLLAALLSIGHVYYASKILSIIIILILLIMYCLFVRFTPKLGYVIVAVPILYILKLPYLIPILMGLFATPIAIIPTGCGVVIYYLFAIIKDVTTNKINISLEDILQLYVTVIDNLVNNKLMLLTIIIFSFIIIITYIIRRKKFDYAREIAIATGALTSILGFLICDLKLDISEQIGSMILGTLGAAILALIIQFFHLALDYTGVEFVQFEDDDYYYYVKAVPKINVTTPEIRVKRINAQKSSYTRSFTGNKNKDGNPDEEDGFDEDNEEYHKFDKGSWDDGK